MFTVLDNYPPGSSRSGDFVTGAAQRTMIEGDKRRKERVIVLPVSIDRGPLRGKVVLSEQTVRNMADVLGFPTVERHAKLLAERGELALALAKAEKRLEVYRSRAQSAVDQMFSVSDEDEEDDETPDDAEGDDDTGEVPVIEAPIEPDGEEAVDSVACAECGRQFDSPAGLKVHRGRAHKVVALR